MKSLLSKKNQLGLSLKKSMKLLSGEVMVLNFNKNLDLENVISKLNNEPEVIYAEPNFIYRAIGTKSMSLDFMNYIPSNNIGPTNDPQFGKLWGLLNTGSNEPQDSRGRSTELPGVAGADVNALGAWEISKGSDSVTIAVIDTGIDYNHEDLKENIWINDGEYNGSAGVDDDGNGFVDDIYGYDFANHDSDPMDGHSHGTHCAGTIGAVHNNGIGVAGVMSDVKMMGVKFLTDEGSGSTEGAIEAIDYATRMNVDLMSNSWGGGGFSQALEDSIKRAKDAGIVFVAAAGNSATDNNSAPHYPSNYNVDNVISVAAHDYSNNLAYFSCFGSRTVHVAAPGRNILSTVTNNSYEVFSGTSMATPHVSGVVGLLLAKEGRQNLSGLRERLMASTVEARAYRRTTIGGGRVDAYNFLTNTRPARNRPSPDAWVSNYEFQFESEHPYKDNAKKTHTIKVPGAKYVRVVVEKYDLERNYDFLTMKDASGAVLEKISGAGNAYVTDYAETDTVTLEFTSDSSQTKWGYLIKEVQFIK